MRRSVLPWTVRQCLHRRQQQLQGRKIDATGNDFVIAGGGTTWGDNAAANQRRADHASRRRRRRDRQRLFYGSARNYPKAHSEQIVRSPTWQPGPVSSGPVFLPRRRNLWVNKDISNGVRKVALARGPKTMSDSGAFDFVFSLTSSLSEPVAFLIPKAANAQRWDR